MFHFTGCRDVPAMDSQELERTLLRSGYPIRKSTGQSVFAALRSLSQLVTSFIVSESQGIHHAPLITLYINILMNFDLYVFFQYVKEPIIFTVIN